MSDRHIRRTGDDYAHAFLKLLPQGQAWPKLDPDSALVKTVRGLCQVWGFIDQRAADLLEIEADPRITTELLTDWERNFGLPDPCLTEPHTVDERRFALVQRMTIEGGASREFFIDLADAIGYQITITEYRTFQVGIDRVGDSREFGDGSNPMFVDRYVVGSPVGWFPVMNPDGRRVSTGELSEWPNYGLGPETNRYYWTVHVHEASLIWFRCGSGQCGVDPHLRIGTADDLECLFNRWKPAHTQIIFDYSPLTPPTDGAGLSWYLFGF